MKVYEAITQAIQQERAEIIFGVMGDANQNMLVHLADQLGVRFLPAHHEQSAVSMADGNARASGKPGLASVTQGPGLTNTATSLVAANRHGSPLLLLAGDVSLRHPSNAQKIDQLAFSLLTAGAGAVVEHPRGVDYALDEAFRSLRGGWGPFVLNVPQDVQNAEMLDPHWSYHPGYQPIERILPPHAGLAQAALCLRAAKRPALLVGLGAVRSGAEDAIRTLAEQLDAPVATTLPAKRGL